MVHRAAHGLDIPISGKPEQVVDRGPSAAHVGLVAADYIGMRPTLHVAVGDSVQRGQLLFEDKKMPGVRYTAPGAGRVAAINRGERRAFQSLVIDLDQEERRGGRGSQVSLASYTGRHPSAIGGDGVRELLIESGLWTALRARPFSRVANPADRPQSVFVTAMDTEPLAPEVEVVLGGREADFERGLAAMAQLTDGPVFVCTADRAALPVPQVDRVRHERFRGPHPAGTVGFHIHRLHPAGRHRLVWHLGYQDVLAIGRLFGSGDIDVTRVVALAGPSVRRPRLIQTRIGASTGDLTSGELLDGEIRVISGSVLYGRMAIGDVHGYLGRYHRQIAALPEGRTREFMGWAGPGFSRFSSIGVFASRLLPGRSFPMTTSTNGSLRAIVPIGTYERVMPFDIHPTYLVKALLTHDLERAEQLGVLELDEEDVALCTFVCPGKHEYGPLLREVLTTIEKEG